MKNKNTVFVMKGKDALVIPEGVMVTVVLHGDSTIDFTLPDDGCVTMHVNLPKENKNT